MRHITPPFILLIVMMMAPQILETLYSPALTAIASDYAISNEMASQTISVYFFAFALGVFIWGIVADFYGRRLAMLAGLSVYLMGAFLALFSPNYAVLLLARLIVAFGIAVGSVITQTIMRDCYDGAALGKAFATMGIALSISPIIGLFTGGALVSSGGVSAVFIGQLLFAALLLFWCIWKLPETGQIQSDHSFQKTAQSLFITAKMMIRDRHIIATAFLIALFNIMVFSYYSLAPFIFEKLRFSERAFGLSGLILTAGTMLGALLNHYLINRHMTTYQQILIAVIIAIIAGILFFLLRHSIGFLLPAGLIMISFGLAIPNILSGALKDYSDRLGQAGAILGLLYYLLIGAGLVIVAKVQLLWLVVLAGGLLALLIIILIMGKENLSLSNTVK